MSIVKTIIAATARFTHFFITMRVLNFLRRPAQAFYTSWIANEFNKCGDDCHIGGFSQLIGAKHISLGNRIYIGKEIVWEVYDHFLDQEFQPSLTFGNDSSFGDGGHISCINKVAVGNGVRIGRKVFITDNSHGTSERSQLTTPAHQRPLFSKGPVIIEDYAWIGEMSCIMPGVTIGCGSIVAANSVVTKDIPPYCIAAGVPATIVRQME